MFKELRQGWVQKCRGQLLAPAGPAGSPGAPYMAGAGGARLQAEPSPGSGRGAPRGAGLVSF